MLLMALYHQHVVLPQPLYVCIDRPSRKSLRCLRKNRSQEFHFDVGFKAFLSHAGPKFAVSTLGDGNCLYRAIARASGGKWFGLKAKSLRDAIRVCQNEAELHALRKLQRRNSWGDEVALAAIARYLGRTIVVFKGCFQCVFTPPHITAAVPICLRLNNSHFETVCPREGISLLHRTRNAMPMTFHEFSMCQEMQQTLPDLDGLLRPSEVTRSYGCKAKVNRAVPMRHRVTRKVSARAVLSQMPGVHACRTLYMPSVGETPYPHKRTAMQLERRCMGVVDCDARCDARSLLSPGTCEVRHIAHKKLQSAHCVRFLLACAASIPFLLTLHMLGAEMRAVAANAYDPVWHHVPVDSYMKAYMPAASSQLLGGAGKGRGTEQPAPSANDGQPFVPAAADISRVVQKLKLIPHGLQGKQIRAIVIADSKVLRRLQTTTDASQLKDIILAAAARFNMTPAAQAPTNMSVSVVAQASPKVAGKGKGANPQAGNASKQPALDPPNPTTKEKGKGKGKGRMITLNASLKLCPDGWNVGVFDNFQAEEGAVYVVESADKIRELAVLAQGKDFPIGAIAPFPVTLNERTPQAAQVEFLQDIDGEPRKILTQAYLHQFTCKPVTYDRQRTVIQFAKPDTEHTQVLHVCFSDSGAPQLIAKELQLLKLGVARQWLESLLSSQSRDCILDMWKLEKGDDSYKVNIRVHSKHVEGLLRQSGPGALQIHASAALKTRLSHVWLSSAGPLTPEKVKEVMAKFGDKHLGSFLLRGCWALRAPATDVEALRSALGQDTKPSFFVKNVPSSWVESDITDLLALLKWDAHVQPNSRRWFKGCTQWIVRATTQPPSVAFPIYFGYERRMIYVSSTKRVNHEPATSGQSRVEQFSTWKAQLQPGAICLDVLMLLSVMVGLTCSRARIEKGGNPMKGLLPQHLGQLTSLRIASMQTLKMH